jgi:hypothetical protein
MPWLLQHITPSILADLSISLNKPAFNLNAIALNTSLLVGLSNRLNTIMEA